MDFGLNDKRALITGSTAGIGYATARALAREGAIVTINGRTQARVDAALKQLAADVPGAKANGIAADLGTAEGCAALMSQLPAVDVLVNNLGIAEAGSFEQLSDADWQRFFEVNVLSGVRMSRQYVGGMRERGWGRIVFVSSESGLQIPAEMVHYGVSKTAQIALARGLAETLSGSGVTVNSVLPGPTAAEGVSGYINKLAADQGVDFATVERNFFTHFRPTSLLKRFAATDEVASMIAYVCSAAASATTGAALRVDGGVVRSIA